MIHELRAPARAGGAWVVCILLAAPLPLLAQTSATDAGSNSVLEEVIVTAQKRPESAQNVPIALTALTDEDLRVRGLTSAKDIATAVPNMVWYGDSNVPNVYIRGVGDSSFHSNQVGGVGMYMDEISLNSPLLWNFGLFDEGQVEVLRGPQNTLFGRNTTGGAVQFTSQAPKIGQDWGGYVSVNGGNYGRFDTEGAVEIPIDDRLAARVSIARYAQGDYLDNINLDRKEGGYERTAGRAQLLWQVTDDLTALFNVHGGFFRGGSVRYKEIGLSDPKNPGFSNCPYLTASVNPGNGCSDQTGFIDSGNFTQESDSSVDIFNINTSGGLVRLDWKLPGLTLTSLTGFEHEDSEYAEDSTGGPSFIFNFEPSTGTNQISQELRAASTTTGPLKWIAGLYFFNEDLNNLTSVRKGNPITTNADTPGLPVPEADVQSMIPFTELHQKDTAWSAYDRTEFDVTQAFSITAGLRFTSESKSGDLMAGAVPDLVPLYPAGEFIGEPQIDQLLLGATQVGPGPLPPQCPAPFPLRPCYQNAPFSYTWNILGGNFSLNYHITDDVLTYASVARGFKGGGVSEAALGAIVGEGGSKVSPEFLWTYELGMKSEWLDHRLRLNAASFYNRWTDEQLFLTVPTPLGINPILTNVPKTEDEGLEMDLTALPARGWSVTVSAGALHSWASDVSGVTGATAGSELIGAPKLTMSTLVRKQWDFSGGSFALEADTHYNGATHWDLADTPYMIEPGYWVHNASASYQFGPAERYQVTAWGKNLTATQYCETRVNEAGLGSGDVIACAPNEATRFFGVSFRANFE